MLFRSELGRTVDYEYDELNRLVKETVTRGVNVSVTEYEYDANSNRTKMIKDGVVTAYTYNELNQITKAGDINYTWDNAGNLVSQSTDTGVLVASYTYDIHNRMISADVSNASGNIVETYTYDYLGNRTSKTSNGVTTEYTTDLSTGYSQVLKAEMGSKTVYYTRGFELISRREGSTASYYVYDGGLSVRALTDETGAVTDTLVFDAFGNATEKTGTTENPYGFQGEEQDATGLYYLRARYMDPSTGTFTTMDTYAGSLSDPMSLHKYMFANANPVKYCDPSGHFTMTEQLLTCALIGEVTSSVLYYVELFTTDNIQYDNPEDYIFGGVKAALTGLLMGVFMCLFYMAFAYLTTAYIATVIFGVSGLFMAGFGMLEGADEIKSGDSALGWTKIVINAVVAAICVFSLIYGTIAECSANDSNGTVNDNSDMLNENNGADNNGNAEVPSKSNPSGGNNNNSNTNSTPENNNANNRFPSNPDDLLPEITRDKIVNKNGTQRQTIYTSDHVRIRAEQHPMEPGDVYNPRHHGVHYHVEIRTNSSLSWNNANNVYKLHPKNYTPGSGTGFLPGEQYPGI